MDEMHVCQAEEFSHCALIGPARYTPIHHCEYDAGHDGTHECACGHRWTDSDD
jgi:hypothetical protein